MSKYTNRSRRNDITTGRTFTLFLWLALLAACCPAGESAEFARRGNRGYLPRNPMLRRNIRQSNLGKTVAEPMSSSIESPQDSAATVAGSSAIPGSESSPEETPGSGSSPAETAGPVSSRAKDSEDKEIATVAVQESTDADVEESTKSSDGTDKETDSSAVTSNGQSISASQDAHVPVSDPAISSSPSSPSSPYASSSPTSLSSSIPTSGNDGSSSAQTSQSGASLPPSSGSAQPQSPVPLPGIFIEVAEGKPQPKPSASGNLSQPQVSTAPPAESGDTSTHPPDLPTILIVTIPDAKTAVEIAPTRVGDVGNQGQPQAVVQNDTLPSRPVQSASVIVASAHVQAADNGAPPEGEAPGNQPQPLVPAQAGNPAEAAPPGPAQAAPTVAETPQITQAEPGNGADPVARIDKELVQVGLVKGDGPMVNIALTNLDQPTARPQEPARGDSPDPRLNLPTNPNGEARTFSAVVPQQVPDEAPGGLSLGPLVPQVHVAVDNGPAVDVALPRSLEGVSVPSNADSGPSSTRNMFVARAWKLSSSPARSGEDEEVISGSETESTGSPIATGVSGSGEIDPKYGGPIEAGDGVQTASENLEARFVADKRDGVLGRGSDKSDEENKDDEDEKEGEEEKPSSPSEDEDKSNQERKEDVIQYLYRNAADNYRALWTFLTLYFFGAGVHFHMQLYRTKRSRSGILG